ncbi:type I-B CRISPR-associated protein Cas7/Cst2/DevR [Thermodesulfovibrio yellowstonii]|uniref:Type I-B CRISPR-associated protein Cas7/Cst2/DevR n=1 Tax=Thermodesulfovibrio yellowstonii TaxID=28262 RepID=A0A9W6LK48_9BACT|nr:type I-B CRISPR-associated protein Cas7/Cst2/DevR [Thermodesulfovibrio islandicus]GLI52445.1 hypothetical protein TISLANDTSLP1_01380 [Thermodesulfovibrio islandicus]
MDQTNLDNQTAQNNQNNQNSTNTSSNSLNKELRGITVTLIFEVSALNRDEKLGGNIPSIKKLTRFGNKTFSYLSRVAVRHYLFETLCRSYPDDWKPAECFESGTGDNKVVQFDLRNQNILTHAELDAFGYMFTIGGQQSLIRKAPVGITKAIALETWEGDMQFNANHDLARRCGANPNPVNKEEQMSYFKVSFTIDVDKLGYDEWWINDYNYSENKLTLFLTEKGTDVVLKNVEKGIDKSHYKIDEHEIRIEGLTCSVSRELMEEETENSKNQEKKKSITFKEDFLKKPEEESKEKESSGKKGKGKGRKKPFKVEDYTVKEEENFYQFTIANYSYDSDKKTLTLSLALSHEIQAQVNGKKYTVISKNFDSEIGEITVEGENSKKRAIFRLANEIKKKRLTQILDVLKNGLIYHSSGECYGIVPKFIIAAGLKLPIPLFHSFVDLGRFEDSILDNAYILCENDKKLVYLYDPEHIVGKICTTNLYTDWKAFSKQIE